MFTRKHYIETAKVVKSLPAKSRKAAANKFAKQYAADNPRFDRAKFLKACGVK